MFAESTAGLLFLSVLGVGLYSKAGGVNLYSLCSKVVALRALVYSQFLYITWTVQVQYCTALVAFPHETVSVCVCSVVLTSACAVPT